MILVINYAAENKRDSRRRKFRPWQQLQAQADYVFGADKVIEYSPKDIDPYFYVMNKFVLDLPRLAGYSLWRPYIIKDALSKVDFGDYVFYVDTGAFFIHDIYLLIEAMENAKTDVMPLDLPGWLLEKTWTKRDAFILMGVDNEEDAAKSAYIRGKDGFGYWDEKNLMSTPQRWNGFIPLKKTPDTVALIDEYLWYMQDPRIVTDIPNKLGKENYEGFKDNRHDQTVWSLLTKKHGIKAFRDPSHFWCPARYGFSKSVLDRSPYPIMFYHHRCQMYKSANLYLTPQLISVTKRILENKELIPEEQRYGLPEEFLDVLAYNVAQYIKQCEGSTLPLNQRMLDTLNDVHILPPDNKMPTAEEIIESYRELNLPETPLLKEALAKQYPCQLRSTEHVNKNVSIKGGLIMSKIVVNLPSLISDYYTLTPDPENKTQGVAFGTSGHRGSSKLKSFNEEHILAIAQAVYEYRTAEKIQGPLFIGADTHALSEPALRSCVEVLAANGVEIILQDAFKPVPTPVVSRIILEHNYEKKEAKQADGIVITPSHNPPTDGGIKYDPTTGGPASAETTKIIQNRANEIIAQGVAKVVKRVPFEKAVKMDNVHFMDYMMPYVKALGRVIDMDAVINSGLNVGADPLGGSGIFYWDLINEVYKIKNPIKVVNPDIDYTFSFMPPDHDGKIRMDCSSPFAMANLIALKDKYDIAFGNDTDYDRHGIVTPQGLMNPNHYLAVAIKYLFTNRPGWSKDAMVGKTLVSSSLIDKVAADIGRKLCEVPVGFKWFVDGLFDGSMGFGGEESAGASFLCKDASVWTTDKDGIIMDLLAVEITAKTGKNPSEHHKELTDKFGTFYYARKDTPATPDQKAALGKLAPENLKADTLAGAKITGKFTKAPGNGASIGGLKVVTDKGWFAARPSGTEDMCKVYAESFVSVDHLKQIQKEAQDIVASVV